MTAYKVLSLHPEHAELFRLGIRTIETRGWATKYRGPLALAATVRDPDSAAARRDPISRAAMAAIPHGDPLPMGCIVVTCTLADLVPIVLECEEGATRRVQVFESGLWLSDPEPGHGFGGEDTREVTDQRPYGDFSPGRYAWLLEDVRPLDQPIPFKGGQGLSRTWEG